MKEKIDWKQRYEKGMKTLKKLKVHKFFEFKNFVFNFELKKNFLKVFLLNKKISK